MKDAARFQLRVTAYSPGTIPMARLAEYMQELATLMGSEASVHFKSVTKGSTILNVEVKHEDVPKVESRLYALGGETAAPAPDDARRALNRLEALLRADNARGALSRDGERIIQFLGIDAVIAERIGPIHEATTVEGEVTRVGGSDKTLHILIEADDGQVMKVTTRSRDLAKQLAVNLFAQVRAHGTGVWYRNEFGNWELDELRLEGFEPVSARTLVEAVSELRAVEGSGWSDVSDPLAVARNLRKH